jgi:hypothetical protein
LYATLKIEKVYFLGREKVKVCRNSLVSRPRVKVGICEKEKPLEGVKQMSRKMKKSTSLTLHSWSHYTSFSFHKEVEAE